MQISSETLEVTLPEEELKETQEEKKETSKKDGQQAIPSSKDPKEKSEFFDDVPTRRQPYDSVDDSSESENSPVPQRKRRTSVGSSSSEEYKQEDSQGSGEDEDFIRKQIIEMSADEDASASEDDEFIRHQLKELSSITESHKKEEMKGKGKATAGKHRRLTRKSSASFDDDAGRRHSWHDEDDETFDESPELKYRETKSQESEELVVAGGGGLRRFKTIELNSTIADKYSAEPSQKKATLYFDEEPELEMESLTDSPEDRSRGEGSSSLHASSFTPEDIVSSSYIIPESHEIVDLGAMVTSTSEEKKLLDADAAYEELMKRQQMQLTPGSSPTQPPLGDDMTESTMDFDRFFFGHISTTSSPSSTSTSSSPTPSPSPSSPTSPPTNLT
ncbi:Hypothetical predicted protein [Marmota monax]|uniref:Uncharacterized protein n=1 Tax=Marmota monax TaxID=9995 RepID=A0A5E4C211_MARMO|nr:hypothetical protein GHT09_019361 [Marmota monax]VTJ74942.1 Hypothetical predicted protein [Marmota monax]